MSHPTIYWAQNKQVVYMRIALVGASDVVCDIEKETFTFAAVSYQKKYECKFALAKPVIKEESKFRVLGQSIEVILKKEEETKEFWPTIQAGAKLPYVRIDFERWIDEDEDEKPKAAIPDFGGMDFSQMGGMEGMPDMSNFKMPEEHDHDHEGCGCDHGEEKCEDGCGCHK
ncbi:Chaperone_HSP82 [Hexamita inflata]|uniref:Putative n=1 Tax=Hexamita inflata TaxID=28002 RepID=A0AA86PHH2_9EUKA|nr:Chaperone HSP82 [Hexamita inflata]CAI9934701.1 Chaperone HSP82 [Hexamita inflata]CAI9939091.1 Chaperone HSP82 [Hexamita inflata]